MVDTGSLQPSSRQPDASHASGTRPYKGREQQDKEEATNANWQKHIDSLLSIEDNLKKEEERAPKAKILQELEKAIKHACALWSYMARGHDATKEQLIQIEASLEKITRSPLAQKSQLGQTWAKVATQQATCMVATSAAPECATIRIQLEGGKDKSPNEILTEAKKVIPGVYAVCPLKSGDIDVMVPDQATK